MGNRIGRRRGGGGTSVQVEVIIKGEYHSSRGDFRHEREILKEGVDHLILEGAKNPPRIPSLSKIWFYCSVKAMDWMIWRPFNTDTTVLEDMAEGQGAPVWKTRESDLDVLENSPGVGVLAAFLVFAFGMIGSPVLYFYEMYNGVLLSPILGLLAPVLLLRIFEMNYSEKMRDEIIAGKIESAADSGGRIVAIVGERHLDNVCRNLPDWIDPEKEPPKYHWYSPRFVKDVLVIFWKFYLPLALIAIIVTL